jgi:hypothetical protein
MIPRLNASGEIEMELAVRQYRADGKLGKFKIGETPVKDNMILNVRQWYAETAALFGFDKEEDWAHLQFDDEDGNPATISLRGTAYRNWIGFWVAHGYDIARETGGYCRTVAWFEPKLGKSGGYYALVFRTVEN